MSILEGDLIKSSIIDTYTGAAVRLLGEDEGKAPGGFRFRYDTVLEVIIDELLDFLEIFGGVSARANIDGLRVTGVDIEGFQLCRASDLTQ